MYITRGWHVLDVLHIMLFWACLHHTEKRVFRTAGKNHIFLESCPRTRLTPQPTDWWSSVHPCDLTTMVLTVSPRRRSVSEENLVRVNSALLGTRVIIPEVCVNRDAFSQLIVVAWQSQLQGDWELPEPERFPRQKQVMQSERRPVNS